MTGPVIGPVIGPVDGPGPGVGLGVGLRQGLPGLGGQADQAGIERREIDEISETITVDRIILISTIESDRLYSNIRQIYLSKNGNKSRKIISDFNADELARRCLSSPGRTG